VESGGFEVLSALMLGRDLDAGGVENRTIYNVEGIKFIRNNSNCSTLFLPCGST